MRVDVLMKEICECLEVETQSITESTALGGLDGWDSVGRLMIVSMLSQTFGIEVNTEKIVQCVIIKDIVDLVRDRLEVEMQ